MGKKSRKLRSPKFRRKSAALRKTVAMINGQLEEVTEETAEITATAEIAEETSTQPAGESAPPKISHPKEVVKAEERSVETENKKPRKRAITAKKKPPTARKNRVTKTKVGA